MQPRPSLECAAILAGGKSSRMGREKALLRYENQPLIARVADVLRPLFSQIVVVSSKPEVASAANLPAIADRFPDAGPLGGIHAALAHFEAPVFVVGCDMPFIEADFIEKMREQFDGKPLAPRHPNGAEPLHAIYTPQNLEFFETILTSGHKIPALHRVLEQIGAQYLSTVEVEIFENWNRPEDVRHR